MAGVQDLLNEAVTPQGASQQNAQNVADVSTSKQAAVAQAATQKQQALGANPDMYSVAAARESGMGLQSGKSPLETDLMNLSDAGLQAKYGNDQGAVLANSRSAGNTELRADKLANRSVPQAVGDFTTGVGLGVANSVGGIAALGAGIVNDDAGVWAANQLQDMNNYAQQNLQSDQLAANRRANQAQADLGYRDSTQQYEAETKNGDNLAASLDRIGRDSLTAVSNAFDSGSLISDGIAQGIGSIATAGPVGRGLAALGKVVVSDATRQGIALAGTIDKATGNLSAARALTAVGSKLPEHGATMASIGLMEGGGAFQQTTQEAYEKLKNRTDLTEDQKVAMANRAGLMAAAVQAPLAAATGSIAAKFEGNPFGAESLREIGKNVLKEGAEEYLQSGTGQLSQNIGIKQEVDPNQSLSEGVGEQAGLGALYGLGSAGAIQTPAVARVGTRAAVTGAVNTAAGVANAVQERLGSITARNDQASPVADAKVSAAATAVQEAAPAAVQESTQAVNDDVAIPDDRKAEINDYVDSLAGAMDFNPLEKDEMSAPSAAAVGEATNRVDALHNMANFVADEKNDPLQRLQVMQDLNAGLNMLNGFIQSEPEGLTGLAEDHPARQLANGVQTVINNVQNTPAIRKATEAMDRIASGAQTDALIHPVTDESLSTPEGQQNVQNHITIAEYAPEKANLDAVETILQQNQSGKIQLTGNQRAGLETAASLLRASKQYDDAATAQGLRPQDVVGKQIKTDDSRVKESQYSALQHAKRIRSAYSAGNFDLARSYLLDFQKFAQHMQNKVGALNSHLASGNSDQNLSVRYQALQDDRTFRESKLGLGVNTQSARSVAFAKQVGLESQTLTDLANSLSTAFPELNVAHMEQTPLDPLLAQGTPQEVAQGFRDGTRKVGQIDNQQQAATTNDSPPVTEGNENNSQTVQPLTEDVIKAMSDDEINTAMTQASQRMSQKLTPVDRDNFSALADEQDARIDAAKSQNKAEPVASVDNSSTETTEAKPLLNAEFTEANGWTAEVMKGGSFTRYTRISDDGLVSEKVIYINRDNTIQSHTSTTQYSMTNADHSEDEQGMFTVTKDLKDPTASTLVQESILFSDGDVRKLEVSKVPATLPLDNIYKHITSGDPDLPYTQVPIGTGYATTGPATLTDRHPSLVQPKSGNKFLSAFTLPGTPRTTIGDETSPVAAVKSALQGGETTETGYTVHSDIARAYGKFLNLAPQIRTALQNQLTAWANKTTKAGNLPGVEFLEGRTDANTYQQGKMLNIAENQNGKLVYNQNLTEAGILAGLHWALNVNNFTNPIDTEGAAKRLGIPELNVSDDLVQFLNMGLTELDAVTSLAQKVRQYWGVNSNSNEKIGYTDGIPSAMAGELLEAMTDAGLFGVNTIQLITTNGNLDTVRAENDGYVLQPGEKVFKRVNMLVVNPENDFLSSENAMRQYPDAIEHAVMIDPENTMFFGDDKVPVPRTQLNNDWVPVTKQQQTVIQKNNATEYFPHMPMVNLYTALGESGAIELLGEGDLSNVSPLYNDNFMATLEGRNTSIRSAYRQLQAVMAAAQNRADTAGVPVEELAHHYGHSITSVNRLQMLGKQNPQSSKLVREAIMPTWSTLDMTNSEHYSAFMLGVGQMLGVKVHNMSREDAMKQTQGILDKFQNSQDVLRAFQQSGVLPSDAIATMTIDNADRNGVPQKLAPMQLQALNEYVRLQSLDESELTSFRTPMYVEADGMTNGVINAIALMTSGDFTAAELDNLSRGGVTVGGNIDSTANNIRQSNKEDMYTATVNILKDVLAQLKQKLTNKPAVTIQKTGVEKLMAMFMANDVSLNSKGDLELERGVTKNPLTITLYGSGTQGIAGKMTKQIADGIYQMLSEANLRMKERPGISREEAMFPGKPEQAAEFMQIMDDLLSTVARSKNGDYYTQNSTASTIDFNAVDFKTFTFTGDQLNALRNNIHTVFVEPMRWGIDKSVGKSVMSNTTLIRRATQVQSIYLQEAFKKAVADRVQWNVDNTPGYKKTEFLSQKELNDIRGSLSSLAPFVQTGTQNFFIAGSQNTDVGGSVLSRNLSGAYATDTMVSGPADSGVSGIPFMNIGMGDGQMIQNAYADRNAPQKSTPIFDGVNLALDRMAQDSTTLNKAVHDAWQNNPLRVVGESLETLMPSLDSAYPTDAHEAIVKALFDDPALWKDAASVSQASVTAEIGKLFTSLSSEADSIDARHELLARTQVAVDQMAAVGSPYVNEGRAIEGTTEEKAAELNARLREKAEPAPAPVVTKEVKAASVVDKSGARVMSQTALRTFMKGSTPTQLKMFQMLMRTLPKGYFKVVVGTPTELAKYAIDNSISLETRDGSDPFAAGVGGLYHARSNTIFVMNGTQETVLHEMIHAATLDRLNRVLNGEDVGMATGLAEEAVDNIKKLMMQFMEMPIDHLTTAQQIEIGHARREIQGWLNSGSRFAELFSLNEFMAWSLANPDIETAQRGTKSFTQMAKDVIKFIKQLVFGRKRIPEQPGEDMFSQLSFNTAILLGSVPTVKGLTTDTAAFQNRAFGNDQNLQRIIDAFEGTVNTYLNADANVQVKSARRTEYANALMSGSRMTASAAAHGFPMTMQQASAYSMIVAALQTQAHIDPNAMARMQELYTHVVENMTVDQLMDKAALDIPSEESLAQERYSLLMGNYRTETDAKGRSTLLPSFMALAMTSPLLREALSEIALPKSEQNTDRTLDAVLENAGQNAMDALSRSMSGQKGENAQDAIDALTNQITDIAQGKETFIDQYASVVGGYVDRANQYLVDQLGKLSDNLMDTGEKLKGSHNKYVGALGSSLRIIGAIATEENGARVAEGVMAGMNRLRGMQPWFDIINDMVGRTSSNANVYDMIKAVRALVQQDRQQFRQHLPTVIADKFSRTLTDHEWGLLHRGLGKTDLTSLRSLLSEEDIHELINDPKMLASTIQALETSLETIDPAHADLYKAKMEQLADYMMNGKVGQNLLRNANAVSALLGEQKQKNFIQKDAAFAQSVDHLTTLYALRKMGLKERVNLSSLVQQEPEGIAFSMAYLDGQRVEEQRKAVNSDRAFYNQNKGYIPSAQQEGVSLIIADDSEFDRLSKMSYERVADYKGSSREPNAVSRGYYFAPVNSRAVYNQGIMQNIRMTANGVDTTTGFTSGITGGIIADTHMVAAINAQRGRSETGENLVPVYGRNGVAVAYERSVAPEQMERLNRDTHFARNIGVWRGRQVEEIRANGVNQKLVDALHEMYTKDVNSDPGNEGQYVNVFDTKDQIVNDATALFTPEIRQYIEQKYGDNQTFMVRRDMLADALGYRDATVGDAWTGNSRWNDRTLKTAQNVAIAMFGNKAYQYATNAEKFTQNLMRDARQMIIVKSVVVPVSNALGNIYQLISRGVPMVNIARQMPRKLAEINMYTKTRIRQIELEAELRADDTVVGQRKISAEIQSITDSHKRLSIWPLIEAGEFSAINDASLDESDIDLTSGRLYSYFEQKVNQLPPAVRTAGRYALITQDTPIFKALEKSVEYGDFLAKAMLYDDIVKRQGKSPEYALSRITEEFVNYDRLPGRFRSYMEKMGLMWFYNFKIRSAKVATSMIRNNPLHSLMAAFMPKPTLFGTVGSPITDNIFTVAADGRLGFSMGIGQAFHAPMLNPWVNIMSN